MDQSTSMALVSRLLLLLITLLGHASTEIYENVITPSGPIRGISVPVRSHNVLQFRNIPYAKPPVGDLRFRKPAPSDAWTNTMDATKFGPVCIQPLEILPESTKLLPNGNMSEDCLSLNIYVPESISLERNRSVMVWMHGGGFYIGTGSAYDGSYLALGGDVIVVTINYRLGVLGFISTEDSASPGNYGLWDQILALKWVKKNIAAFGGDSESITIFGESAGSVSVSLQMLVPENRGLFQRAIGQSGAAPAVITFSRSSLNDARGVGRGLKCIDDRSVHVNTFSLVDCLRQLPVEDILQAQNAEMFKAVKAKDFVFSSKFLPVIDGDLFNKHPINVLKEKESYVRSFYQSLDYIAGTTNQEGNIALMMLAMYQQELSFNMSEGIPERVLCDMIAPVLGRDVFQDKTVTANILCDFYKSDEAEEQGRRIIELFGDVTFYSSTVEALDHHSMNNEKANTFQYLFSKSTDCDFLFPLPSWAKGQSTHGEDLFFLFGPHALSKKYDPLETEASTNLLQRMIKYWTNFAKTGDPNGSGLPEWPRYRYNDRSFIDLNDDITPQKDLFADRMTLHLNTIPSMIEQKTKVINTPVGPIKGIYIKNGSSTILQFRNIPYAKAPTGDLRFRKPVAFGKWKNTLDATAFGPSCIQSPFVFSKYLPINETSEDCLSLNIYVPETIDPNKKRSVMVWIHGGAFIFGEGSGYDGSWIASGGDVIVVTINYRLGVFGFLSTEDSASHGNYGLWDQRMALKWVKNNIEVFGGDPNSITIFGESAGSFSVTLQMLIPENKGLFHRVIAQSGTATSFITYSRNALKLAEIFGEKLNCTTNENVSQLNTFALVDCLRNRNVDELLGVQQAITDQMWSSKEPLIKDRYFWPVIDNELFNQGNPVNHLNDRTSDIYNFFHSIDIIGGSTDWEGKHSYIQFVGFQEEYKFNITEGIPKSILQYEYAPVLGETLYNSKTVAAKALYDFYQRNDDKEQGRQITHLQGDAVFVAPTVQFLDFHSNENDQSQTYQYIFSRGIEFEFFPGAPSWTVGKAGHLEDLFFLFGPDVLMEMKNPFVNEEAKQFSTNMIKYWTNFAKTGDPNGEDLPTWPTYNSKDRSYIDLGLDIASKKNVYSDRTTLILETIPTMIEESTVFLSTPSGPMRGINIPVGSQNVVQFRNIPYAKAPIKKLRFKKTVPFGKWTETLDATAFGMSCIQDTAVLELMRQYMGPMKMSEDCLSLNVYVPGSVSANFRKSVMVWIHGGGFFSGQGTIYDGSRLALEGDVIVVTINYRLGALGFLTTGDSSAPGNYGLWDQRTALQWVKDNIEAFGGNSESITLFGESAGSFSVTYQMMIPENKGLFHRAIAESGAGTLNLKYIKEPFDMAKSFGKDVKCIENLDKEIATFDLIDCIRKVDTDTILKVQNNYTYSIFGESKFNTVFGPLVQDEELFKHGNPLSLLSDSNSVVSSFYKSVDFIGGTNSLDGSLVLMFVLGAQQSKGLTFNISEGIPASFVRDLMIPGMADAYFDEDKTIVEKALCDFYCRQDLIEQGKQLMNLYGDVLFLAPKIKALNFHSNKNTLSNTYQYLFSHGSGIPILVPIYDWTTGAGHGEDLFYLFGPDTLARVIDVQNSTDTAQLSSYMLKYWTNFAKNGDPNGDGLPQWPRYDSTSKIYLDLDLKIQQGKHLYADRMNLILETIPELDRKANQKKDRDEL